VNQAANGPSSGAVEDLKKIVISNHPTSAIVEPGKKNAKNNGKTGDQPVRVEVPVPDANDAEQNYDPKNVPGAPVIPEINFPDLRPNKRGVRRLGGGVTTRNFPDGKQLMTLPDGTRVVTMPDGTKRVFRPGEKIFRRKGLR
jgi:hypothetical protein